MCAYMMMALLKLLYHKLDILLVASGFFSELLLVSGKVLKAKRGGRNDQGTLCVKFLGESVFQCKPPLPVVVLIPEISLIPREKDLLAFLLIHSASFQERKRPFSA